MAFYGDDEFFSIKELIKSCQVSNHTDKRLEMCNNLCKMMMTQTLSEGMDREIRLMEKYTQALLTDYKFKKKVYKRQALTEREPITYYGDDLIKDDPYDYDEEFEREITMIEFKITTFLGNILAFIQEQGGI